MKTETTTTIEADLTGKTKEGMIDSKMKVIDMTKDKVASQIITKTEDNTSTGIIEINVIIGSKETKESREPSENQKSLEKKTWENQESFSREIKGTTILEKTIIITTREEKTVKKIGKKMEIIADNIVVEEVAILVKIMYTWII